MRPPRLAGVGVLLLSASVAAHAATDRKAETMLRDLGKASDSVRTLRAEFVQEKHVAIVRDVLRSSGTFLLDKSGRIAWVVRDPEPLRLVIRKDGVFAGGKPIAPQGAAAGASPLPMIEGMSGVFAGLSPKTAEAFDVTSLAPDRLRLVPRSPELARWVSAIEITVDAKTKTPARVRLEEPGGDLTDIVFRDVAVNPPLDDAAFAP